MLTNKDEGWIICQIIHCLTPADSDRLFYSSNIWPDPGQ